MTFSFNLVDAPWIPCLDAEGRALELGLQETLTRAHELRELGGESPLATAALYRLLLAVTHRVYNGPAGYNAWADLWEARHFDAAKVTAYLTQWRERFDLFHPERPFYQKADARCKPKSLTALIFDAASGNNATLFDHHTDADGILLTPAQAARALLAAQTFGLAGLSLPGNPFTDAPCTRGIFFLVQGNTIFETLLLNLLRYDEAHPLPRRAQDCPAWEMEDPFTPERKIPYGYLDYLTWQNRRVLYLPEETTKDTVVREMTLGPGLRLDATIEDPMKHYRKDEKHGALVLRFDEDRALWRNSAALFSLTKQEYRPPLAFHWLAELISEKILPKAQTRRMLALGMATNLRQAAKVEFFRAEYWPLPLEYLQEQTLVDSLSTMLEMAELASNQLWGATRTLATFVLCPEADQEGAHQPDRKDLDNIMKQWDVKRRYWSQLEVHFRRILEQVPQARDAARAAWQQTLRRTAWSAFDSVAEDLANDPRALKAFVNARQQLAAGLGKVLPENKSDSPTVQK